MAVKRWNGTAWEVYAGADLAPVKVTDGRVGKTTFIGATSPTGQVDGDIWIDQDTTTNAVVPTALTTKGDTFVATGNAAYTRLAAGSNGESLFADSSTNTGLRWQGDFNTGKNKILNGDFSIWQRGTTLTYSGPTIYSADRWICSGFGSGQAFTITRSTSGAPPGFRSYARISPTTSNVTNLFFTQSLETANVIPLQGQNVILSLYYRTPVNFTVQWSAEVVYSTGIDANLTYPTAATFLGGSSLTNSASWQRLTINCGVLPTNATSLTVQLYTFNNVVNGAQLDITGVQLEAGSVATQFTTNTANPQQELAACQRYFIRYAAESVFSRYGVGLNYATNQSTIMMHLPVEMRALPTLATTGTASNYAINHGSDTITALSAGPSIAGAGYSKKIVNLNCVVSSGLTAGSFGQLVSNNNTLSYLDFSAEL
jgi:hypothetical protein